MHKDNRLQGWYHVKNVFRHQHDKNSGQLFRPSWGSSATRVLGLKWVQSTELDIVNGSFRNCWAGVTYLRYTVLKSPNKGETAMHCCDPALSVLVILVFRNVFHVVSALQSIVLIYIFWLIRSFVDPTLAAFYSMRSLEVKPGSHLCDKHKKKGTCSFSFQIRYAVFSKHAIGNALVKYLG